MPGPEELQLQIHQRLLGELEAREQRHRDLLEGLRDPVVELKDGRITYLNPAWSEQLGYSVDHSINRDLIDFIVPADRDASLLHREAEPDGKAGNELRLLAKDGREIWFELRLRAHIDGRHLGILHNIDLRRRAEDMNRRHAERLAAANEELQRAARLKDEFLAAMSHELRTPLNSILGFAELLNQEVHGPLTEGHHKALRHISESGSHLLSLINDILDLSKIEAGQESIETEPVVVDDLCDAVLRLVSGQAHGKRQKLSLDNGCEGMRFMADQRRLKQILVNLLGNAVKFTPEEGSIRLAVCSDPASGQVLFRVSDNGIGIAAKDLDRLFQPFSQLDSRLSRRYSGTGLGLALVKKLCVLHGGSIEVDSSPGKGSTFTVRLPAGPVGEEDQAGDRGSGDETVQRGGAGRRKVLIAEDDLRNQRLIVSYLSAVGFETRVCVDGFALLDAVGGFAPDIILMDVQMPGMDGLEATRRLKKDPATAGIPVIVLTALAMKGDRERCMEAGADAYLSKPVKLKELSRTLDDCLDSRQDSGTRADA